MIKFTILLKRRANLSHEEFVKHYKSIHADLFMSIPVVKKTVRGYIQQHLLPIDLPPGMLPMKYDGVTELWFDTIESLAECFSDAEYLAKIKPDEERFLDLQACNFFISTENKVL